MPDVVLPVLDEAQALPWVLDAHARRLPRDRRRQRLDRRLGRDRRGVTARVGRDRAAARLRRRVLTRGCSPPPPTSSASWTPTPRSIPRDLPRVAGPGDRAARRDLVLGSRRAERGAWPVHARVGNRVLARRVAPADGCAAARPRADAGGAARRPARARASRDRRFGWPLEMVLRAAAAGWTIAEVDVAYLARSGRSKVTGTVRGTVRTVRDMTRARARRDADACRRSLTRSSSWRRRPSPGG